MAWSTVWWMPKTFVSPVILKIFGIGSCVQTRSSDPSCAEQGDSAEADGVEEPDLVQVDDELVAVLVGQIDERSRSRGAYRYRSRLDVDDLDAVLA